MIRRHPDAWIQNAAGLPTPAPVPLLRLPARYLFVDLLRAWAVIFMVETHVVNALLRADLKQTPAFAVLNFANGLVAPAFLFLSGFNFTLSADRHLDQYVRLGAAFWGQLRRLAMLLLLGYALHLPFFSLVKTLTQLHRQELETFLQSDVLQAIAVSLIGLLLLQVVTRSPGRFGLAAALIAAAVALATPVVWSLDLTALLPLPLATCLDPRHGSPFPLFPWSAFVLAGSAAGAAFIEARQQGQRQLTAAIANLFLLGLALLVLGPIGDSHLVDLYPRSGLPVQTPGFFAVRLGIVLMGLSLLALRTSSWRPSVALRVLQTLGQESLLIYCFGLLLLYGWVLDFPRLVAVLGPRLDFAGVLSVFILVATLTSLAALLWHWFSRRYRREARLGQYAALGLLTCLFLLRPY